MMKQADAVKQNALLKTPKKCKPQLLRSSPFYLPIPLVKGGGGAVRDQYMGIGELLMV